MRQKKNFLIVSKDIKTDRWRICGEAKGYGSLIPLSGSPMLLPFFLVWLRIKLGKIDAVCLRYLNDYPSLARTILRSFSEALSIVLALILRSKIYWICHNVDRESAEYYPSLTSFRRKVILRFADRVFFTSKELCLIGKATLPSVPRNTGIVSFGGAPVQTDEDQQNCMEFRKRISGWVDEQRANGRLVGLWIGTVAPKNTDGLIQVVSICAECNEVGGGIALVMFGRNIKSLSKTHPDTFEKMVNSNNILIDDSSYDLHPECWPCFADFVFKPYSDQSTPLTVPFSAHTKLPYLAFYGTFLGEYVENNKIGFGVRNDATGSDIASIINDSLLNFDEFTSRVNWENGAKELFDDI